MSTGTVAPEIMQIARELAPALIVNYGRFVSQAEILAEINKQHPGLGEDDRFQVVHQVKCFAHNALIHVAL